MADKARFKPSNAEEGHGLYLFPCVMAISKAARRFWANASSRWSKYHQSHVPTPTTHFNVNANPVPVRFASAHSRRYLPFPKWLGNSGPLFLKSPTWQLSQAATPLSLSANFVGQNTDNHTNKDVAVQGFLKKHLHFPRSGRIRVGLEGIPAAPVVKLEIKASQDSDFLFNLPNLVSFSRMFSGPLIGWLIINDMYCPALSCLALAGASDWLDGYLARQMKIKSVLGSYLDPLADKVLIISVVASMIKKDLLPLPLVALVVARDCALIGGALYKHAAALRWQWKDWKDFMNVDKHGAERVKPLFISKVNTVLQIGLVGVAILQPEIGADGYLVTWLSWAVATTTLGSGVQYGRLFIQKSFQPSTLSSKSLSAIKSKSP